MATETALARREQEVYALVSGGPVSDLKALGEKLTQLRQVANVLAPSILGVPIPAKQAVALSVVQIDVTLNKFGSGREIYVDRRFCEDGEAALGRVAILKILAGAGISVVASTRIDDRSERFYCEWQVTLAGRDLSGQWTTSTANKELDFRDGSPHLTKPEKTKDARTGFQQKTGRTVLMDESAIADMRRHQAALAESKALLRAARNFPDLALAQKYKISEIEKLWITPRLVPNLDPNDPLDSAALRDEALGRTRQLYGGAPPVALKPAPHEIQQPRQEAVEAEVVQEKPVDTDSDFVPGDFEVPEPEEKPVLYVCACTCGDQHEITEAVAKATTEKVGGPRCKACYPGPGFDYETHLPDVPLGYPKYPKMTAADVKRSQTK